MKHKLWLSLFLVLILSSLLFGADYNREINLRGKWKIEIGDQLEWAKPHFDDSNWESIYVPGNWEDQGFPGYDGFAWLRKPFEIPSNLDQKILYLRLGQIDDVDEVYFNGKRIGGSGRFPPEYHTAYNVRRVYHIPPGVIRFDRQNVIAIRIFDEQLQGGIIRGNIGIYTLNTNLVPDLNLSGYWKFKAGDNPQWAAVNLSDDDWDDIIVPGFWEGQGYYELDGVVWYRKRVIIPPKLADEKLILTIGRIDDVDQVFFNGEKIGSTGPFPDNLYYRGQYGDWYLKDRAYYIPPYLIKSGEVNIIAIRVFDAWLDGGIWHTPVGLFRRDNYRRIKDNKYGLWDLLEDIFE